MAGAFLPRVEVVLTRCVQSTPAKLRGAQGALAARKTLIALKKQLEKDASGCKKNALCLIGRQPTAGSESFLAICGTGELRLHML